MMSGLIFLLLFALDPTFGNQMKKPDLERMGAPKIGTVGEMYFVPVWYSIIRDQCSFEN